MQHVSVLVLEKCMRDINMYSQCTHIETCIWEFVAEPAYENSMNDESEGI